LVRVIARRVETVPLDTCGRKPRPQDGSKSVRGHHLLGSHSIVSAITCVLIALAVSTLHSGKPSRSTDSRNSFWDVEQCGFILNRRFGETCRLLSVSYRLKLFLARVISSTLKMEGARSSETSVYNKPTWRHIPEERIIRSHRRENLKSYKQCLLCYRRQNLP
jgi:hypothetical protein